MSRQITTLTFFRYKGIRDQWWALRMMQFAHPHFLEVPGQLFYKLMGSGKGIGFNPWPDWSVYCLLQVWEEEEAADEFFQSAAIMDQYRSHTTSSWTLYMKTRKAHGSWSGAKPFAVSDKLDTDNPLLAVITRATIRKRKLWDFWRYVPTSERPLYDHDGLLYTKGIGEIPVVQMATFSLWKDQHALQRFAYRSPEHQEAIRRTRTRNWYKEELFARFQPYRSFGAWPGLDLSFLDTPSTLLKST